MDTLNLSNPEFYINRELSLLEFNRRVIAQAEDESMPVLERLKFLCIASTNLDEFFEIRVAGVKQQVKYGSVQTGPDNLSPVETLKQIGALAHELVDTQYSVLNDVITPKLESAKIQVLRRGEWKPAVSRWIKRYFNSNVLPVLSPIGLDPAHPFPRVLNKNLYFIVTLDGKDAFGRETRLSIVQAPRSLPRVVHLPEDISNGKWNFVLLSSIIHAHVDDLFPGMTATGCYQFKVTRNSELFVDDEEVDDLLIALEGELPSRRFNDAVRLEVADNCPADLSAFLLHQFELDEDDLYKVNGPVNLNRLMAIYDLVDKPELTFAGFTPDLPRRLQKNGNIFDALKHGDILLHHPFQSFAPVIDFVRQAANDPNVLSIKQTLYRTGDDSALVDALKDAARSGKEVTVVIELRARFDEQANIELANELQEAGAHVVYGVVGYKTHSKMVMVVRREGRSLRRYVHLGTGNYHARTARLYTDYGLLTCDKAVAEDVNKLFLQLTGLGRASKLKKLLQSPFTLYKSLPGIYRTRGRQRQGRQESAYHRQDECPGGPGNYPRPVQGIHGRCAHRPDHPWYLLPASRNQRPVGEHPRALHRRPLPGAYPGILFPERGRRAGTLFLRRLDAAQPAPSRGSLLPHRGEAAQGPGHQVRPAELSQ